MKLKANIKTLKVRVKDKHKPVLERMAFEVNQVWNGANEITADDSYVPVPGVGYIRNSFTAYELQKQLKSIKLERGFIIHSTTVQEVIAAHHKSRRQFKTDKLRWRVSGGPRRSLGWIPFKKGAAKWKKGQVYFASHSFKVWDSYGLSQQAFRSGSFSQDARGRWYFNIVVEVALEQSIATGQVGIDLGLKDTATCSNGLKLEAYRFYRNGQAQLAKAQRANKNKRVKAIHAKIKNRRLDALHKFTTQVVHENAFIVVGNVSSSSLAKTKMAKSVLDAGGFILKTQLDYKSKAMQAEFVEINEAYTTQACSCCGGISNSSPRGRAGLGIREWSCPECGAHHDRDVNAAMNILAAGHRRLAEGIPLL
ncbi:transposase IS605 OrfB [Nitrosococcus halophilus Nc 4]|uniref:Transposase IS605 OrfB n=1 Tax=Nitrosococcus halophilus (strain Nc4) TaxID=472759 RepID=D5BXG9_NITHN|nr:RNA-guided endonuclease TnpB family protein [Nitrosococcus halophilus]ADE13927.1 transposase IS605 OrfB [Nitrosococcus halophilus Nc 4]